MWALALALLTFLALLAGYPVAFTLAGSAALFAVAGAFFGAFDPALLQALPGRIFAIFTSDYLMAIPAFVLVGVAVEKSGLARETVFSLRAALGGSPNGLAIAVVLAGTLLASVTGIVGASVVALGLIAAGPMLEGGASARQTAGTICAAGTLGQLIPPSIVLLLLADVMQNANSEAQLALGNFAPDPVSAADLFAAAIVPGLLLAGFYIVWLVASGGRDDDVERARPNGRAALYLGFLALLVLGSIFTGIATVVEAAAIGAVVAVIIAWLHQGQLQLWRVAETTLMTSSIIFTILIGATFWSLVFRAFGGDHGIQNALQLMPGGLAGAVTIVMATIFIAGFVLELIEILLIIVPVSAPTLIMLGADPVWLAILIGINLQTSFLTPPMGISLFYFKTVAPKSISTMDIYKGVVPFVSIQLMVLLLVAAVPALATFLPELLFH